MRGNNSNVFKSTMQAYVPTLSTFSLLMSKEGLKGKGSIQVSNMSKNRFLWSPCLLEYHCLLSEFEASSCSKGKHSLLGLSVLLLI